MFFIKLFKYCFGGVDNEPEVLPLMRIANPKPMPVNVTCHLPISAKPPIPQLDVSASSSTSTAMFEYESIASMGSPHSSFMSNDTFDDVDLSTIIKFCAPPKARKLSLSPCDDQYETESDLVTPGSLKNLNRDDQVPNVTTIDSIPLLAHTKQSTPTTSFNICTSPFDDKHHVESDAEIEIEYAPTTPSSGSDYAERAMYYQRGK